MVSADGLFVEPLWNASSNDTDSCLVNTTEDRTIFRGSVGHSCNLNVIAAQEDLILLEIQGKGDFVQPSFLYVKRIGELEECPNRYVAFRVDTEPSLPCNSVFNHKNLEVVLQGNINVYFRSIPTTLQQCPEVEWDTAGSELSQNNNCKNVKGYSDIVKCESNGNRECRISFETDCHAILSFNEVTYQCNENGKIDSSVHMIAYSQHILILDLSRNKIIELQDSFNKLPNLQELDLNDNKLVTLDVELFNGLHALVSLNLGYNKLSELSVELFEGLTMLEHLHLTSNAIINLPTGVFINLVNLKTLNLAQNRITKLSAELLTGLSSLEELHFNNNFLNSLPVGVFQDLIGLNILNIDFNVIRSLHGGSFFSLNKLKTLYINQNRLSSLSDKLFKNLMNLEILILNSNQIFELDGRVFYSLSQLKILQLRDNLISLLPNGLFEKNIHLETLNLERNQITLLPEGLFHDLSRLRNLIISFNMWRSIPVRVFRNLKDLESLWLVNIQISTLNEGTFRNLYRLKLVMLDDNMLRYLPERLFKNLTNLESLLVGNNRITTLWEKLFLDLCRLTLLNLPDNMLSSLPNRLFQSLIKLEQLYLDNNQITVLSDGLFSGLSSLQTLSLGDNFLTSLPDRIFEDLVNLTSLYLYGNDFSRLSDYYRSIEILTVLSELDLTINQPPYQVSTFNASFLTVFKRFSELSTLTLQSNMTQEVISQPNFFDDLANLSDLGLYLSNLITLNAEMFNALVGLYYLKISGTKLTELPLGIFDVLVNLYSLYIDSNQLIKLPSDVFDNLHRLQDLSIDKNQLSSLDKSVFRNLVSLQVLVLSNNHLTHLDYDILAHNVNLQTIELAFNKLKQIPNMKHLSFLQFIDVRNNTLTLTSRGSVSFASTEIRVVVSQHEVCECYITTNALCQAVDHRSPYLTCDRLISAKVFVIIIWVIGLNAFGGNLFVLLWRRKTSTKNKVNSLLLGNLAVSDFLMGIYMIIIGSADLYFGEGFPLQAESWRSGITCKIAGALSITSSEASVFFVTLISIERLISIRFPWSTKRMTKKSAILSVALVWFVSLLLAIVPSIFARGNFKFYDNSHVCIGLPLALTKTYSTDYYLETYNRVGSENGAVWANIAKSHFSGLANGLYFSTAVFLGLNLICYLIITGCYMGILRLVQKSSNQVGRTRNMTEQIRLTTKVSAIVATAFCCWFPIIILGILVQARVITLPASVFAWCVTFVLPINSAINPYLYTIAEVISNYRNKRAENIKRQEMLANQKESGATVQSAGGFSKPTAKTNVSAAAESSDQDHGKKNMVI